MFEIHHYIRLETIWARCQTYGGYRIFVWTRLPLPLLSHSLTDIRGQSSALRPSPSTSAAHGADAEQRGGAAAAGARRASLPVGRGCGGRCAAGARAERRGGGGCLGVQGERGAAGALPPRGSRRAGPPSPSSSAASCSSFTAPFSPVASPWGAALELQSAALGAPGGAGGPAPGGGLPPAVPPLSLPSAVELRARGRHGSLDADARTRAGLAATRLAGDG